MLERLVVELASEIDVVAQKEKLIEEVDKQISGEWNVSGKVSPIPMLIFKVEENSLEQLKEIINNSDNII